LGLHRIADQISSSEMARSPTPSPANLVPEPSALVAPATPMPATYELALAELDKLVAQMEGGQLPLDHLLDAYRRGAELLNFCRAKLQKVEEQVKVLEDGQLKSWANT
jgi:exodeoxyribonuclease VII small subunit